MSLLELIFPNVFKNVQPIAKRKKPAFIKIETIEGVTFKFKKHTLSKYIKMSVKENTNSILVTFPVSCSFKRAKEYALMNLDWAKECLKNRKPPIDDETLKSRRKLAKQYLPKRLEELSKIYGLKYQDVRLKNVRTRWGSCSSKNNINLNINLMALDKKLIDYVLIHELCHTVHKNHGALFWNLVQSCMPDATERRRLLKKERI